MELQELRELFCAKIGLEICRFKKTIIEQNTEVVYGSAFCIDCMITIYELLLELSQKQGEQTLKKLLVFPSLLTFLYGEWMKVDDSHMEELQNCLENTIKKMEQRYQVIDKGEKAA